MTRPIAERQAPKPRTLTAGLLDVFGSVAAKAARTSWPSDRWRADPVGFARDVLGVTPTPQQCAILEAARDHKRVAVRSGNRCGKSEAAAMIAIWFYCSFPDARVVITAPTARQVDAILWRAIVKLHTRATIPIGDEPGGLARTGLHSSDFREISGFSASEAEAVSGIAGPKLLYLIDEASGVDDVLLDAVEGNLAGGGRVVMISNPTRASGRFYQAFTSGADAWRCLHISSLETPNMKAGRVVVDGLADPDWVALMRRVHGEDSAFFRIRVLGEFVLNEQGRVISAHAIQQAQTGWHGAADGGELWIGLDPAGPASGGDESAFAIRRGNKILEVRTFRALDDEGHRATLSSILKEFRKPGEVPSVVLDSEGPIGSSLWRVLKGVSDRASGDNAFRAVRFRGSERAKAADVYDRKADELWANLARWIREGGSIPPDIKLEQELHAPEWHALPGSNRLKLTPKTEIRRALGRSPDRADAVALSCWTSTSTHEVDVDAEQERYLASRKIIPLDDAYAGLARPGGALDPYGYGNGGGDPYG